MRLDHLLSRENFYLLLRKWNEETLSPRGLIVLGLVLGAIGYRNNQAGHLFLVRVCLFGSLTLEGLLVFWGFLGWLFVFWRVDVSVFVMLFCENLVR